SYNLISRYIITCPHRGLGGRHGDWTVARSIGVWRIDGGTWIAKALRLVRRVRPERYGAILRAARLPPRTALRRGGRVDRRPRRSACCDRVWRTHRTRVRGVGHDRRRGERAL